MFKMLTFFLFPSAESLESLSNSTDGQTSENVKKERPVKRKTRNAAFVERNIQVRRKNTHRAWFGTKIKKQLGAVQI